MAVDAPKVKIKNPNCCTSAFGRIFYAYDSAVLFSQVIVSERDAGRCYQNNDPTSEDIPDLLDTDGGLITLEESVRIKALKAFKSGVLVFATNGVWYIYNPDGGFKATAFNVAKVSETGIESERSIVEAEGSLMFLSNSAVVLITASEFDVLQTQDISSDKIRSYFLDRIAGKKAQGIYNRRNKQVEWWTTEENPDGLIFDLESNGFYPQKANSSPVKPLSLARPFAIDNDIFYPAWIQNGTENLEYFPAQLTDTSFQDFGEDIDAFLISGYESLGKFSHSKRVNTMKVFFQKTEKMITGYEDGKYTFDSPSSCLFQARWDYDNTGAGNNWYGDVSNERIRDIQLYQPMQRGFIPTSFPQAFDNGDRVVSTKVRVRGSGDAVQFVFKAEPNKDMKMLGYSVSYDMGARM
jgi:hypothetical protein